MVMRRLLKVVVLATIEWRQRTRKLFWRCERGDSEQGRGDEGGWP